LAIGFALAALQRRLASSPEAIFQSLRRRKEKLTAQLIEAQKIGKLADARLFLDDDDSNPSYRSTG